MSVGIDLQRKLKQHFAYAKMQNYTAKNILVAIGAHMNLKCMWGHKMNARIFVASQDQKNGTPNAIRQRMHRLGTPFKTGDKRVKFLLPDGRSALSVAIENKISSQTFYKRLRAGWKLEKACQATVGKQGKINYERDDKENLLLPDLV